MKSISLYQHCLFCLKELSNNNDRFREHIIPQNIFGFLKSKDICVNCGELFGNNVDDLALKQPLILEALKEFGHPKSDIFNHKLQYYGIDTSNGSKIPMIKKKNGYYIKSSKNIIDENALPWLIKNKVKNNPNDIEEELLNNEISKLVNEEIMSRTGEIISSNKLNVNLIKRQAKGPFIDDVESVKPLIAKIAVFGIYYLISPNQIRKIENFNDLKNLAMLKDDIASKFVFKTRNSREKYYRPFHRIWIHLYPSSISVDVYLFFYLRWSIHLNCNEPIVMRNDKEQQIKSIGLKLDFENTKHPKISALIEPH